MIQLEKEILRLRVFGALLMIVAFFLLGWLLFLGVLAMVWMCGCECRVAVRQDALRRGRDRL